MPVAEMSTGLVEGDLIFDDSGKLKQYAGPINDVTYSASLGLDPINELIA